MEVKVRMRKVILLVICLHVFAAKAECYVSSGFRADSRNMLIPEKVGDYSGDLTVPSGSPRDIRRTVTPYSTGHFICTVLFRISINNVWMDAKGQAVGKNDESEDLVCKRALDLKHAQVLVREGGAVPVSAETQMTCTDLPVRQVRIVQVGELVFESEVELTYQSRFADYPQAPFFVEGVEHKFFTERIGQPPHYRVLTGIIRRTEAGPNGRWQVVDKF
jgi:hypothetical protein